MISNFIKKNFFLIVLIVLFIPAVALNLSGKSGFSANEFFEGRTNFPFNYLVYFLVMFLPLFFYLRSGNFRILPHWTDKMLMIALTASFLSSIYEVRSAVYFSEIFFVVALIYSIRRKTVHRPDTGFYLLALYFLIIIISFIWTKNVEYAVYKLQHYLLILAFPVVFLLFKLTNNQIDDLLKIFFRGVLIFALISIVNWLFEVRHLHTCITDWTILSKRNFNEFGPYFYIYNWTNFDHPTFNAVSYVLASVFGFRILSKSRKSFYEFLPEFIVLSLAVFLLIVVSQSRYGLVMFAMVYLAGIAYLLRKRKKLMVAFLLAGVIFSGWFAIDNQKKITRFLADPPRVQQIKTSLYVIENHPFLGVGLGSMTDVFKSKELANKLGYSNISGSRNIYPSNQFLGDWTQSGILAFVAIWLIMFYLMIRGIRAKSWILIMFFSAFILLMMIEMPLYIPKSTIFFVAFYCLLMQADYSDVETKNEK